MSEKKKKVLDWIKAKRTYIVLALCILSAVGTYALLQRTSVPQVQTRRIPEQQESAPLPDLAEYFPPELEPSAIRENREEQTKKEESTAAQETYESITTASGNTQEEKVALSFRFPVDGEVQKAYSGDTLVYSYTMEDWRAHGGIDITASEGTDVKACADGVVEDIYTDDALGITIVLRHAGGIRSVYSNLSSGLLIEVGQTISGGETISSVGNSALYEAADESHLHFEMTKDGESIDPLSILK